MLLRLGEEAARTCAHELVNLAATLDPKKGAVQTVLQVADLGYRLPLRLAGTRDRALVLGHVAVRGSVEVAGARYARGSDARIMQRYTLPA